MLLLLISVSLHISFVYRRLQLSAQFFWTGSECLWTLRTIQGWKVTLTYTQKILICSKAGAMSKLQTEMKPYLVFWCTVLQWSDMFYTLLPSSQWHCTKPNKQRYRLIACDDYLCKDYHFWRNEKRTIFPVLKSSYNTKQPLQVATGRHCRTFHSVLSVLIWNESCKAFLKGQLQPTVMFQLEKRITYWCP